MSASDFADRFDEALARLHEVGLNWVAFATRDEARQLGALPTHADSGLLLLLNLGAQFARAAVRDASGPDPVDSASARHADWLVTSVLHEHDAGARRLYPGGPSLDLRRWLAVARAQYRSPLGTGIRPDAGPWLAVRAAIGTRLPARAVDALRRRYPPLPDAGSPCDQCETQACVHACPAGSLHATGDPDARDLQACIDHRLRSGSACAERCFAREACPVGASHRYPSEQLRYHYRASLVTLQRWRG